jgi:hypothetical protein
MLNGYAYFGSAGGTLFQMDPRTLATRLIPRDASAPRDHSQLVAFQGELWMRPGDRGLPCNIRAQDSRRRRLRRCSWSPAESASSVKEEY